MEERLLNPQPLPDDYEPKGLWTRIKEVVIGSDELDEEEQDTAVVSNSRKQQLPLRLQTARSGRVAVRLSAQVFEDAKLAADGLKSGEYQIVNMEKATPDMAERVIDFLNGVCYALDGTVERVGDKVYMFVPANVVVEVDNGAMAANAGRRPGYSDTRD